MRDNELPVEMGIKIQTEQLDGWKTVLQPHVYEALVKYATQDNNKTKSGYDICRGVDLDEFIGNYIYCIRTSK